MMFTISLFLFSLTVCESSEIIDAYKYKNHQRFDYQIKCIPNDAGNSFTRYKCSCRSFHYSYRSLNVEDIFWIDRVNIQIEELNYYKVKLQDIPIEELHYYKVKLDCESQRPLHELVSYYRIKTNLLAEIYDSYNLERNLESFCSNQTNRNEYLTKMQMFCDLYYTFEYRTRHIFTVQQFQVHWFSASIFIFEASNSLGKNLWTSIFNIN